MSGCLFRSARALALGANADDASGQHALYMGQYYGAFVRDPDGHKVEAMFRHASAG